MKMLLARFLLVALLLAVPFGGAPAALAQDHGDEEATQAGGEGHGGIDFLGGPDWTSVKEVTIWSVVGVGAFSVILGVLYLFKRKVGGFPEHPSWVAPISIMPASELPGDDDAGHEDHSGHGAPGGHGGHALAH